jgi:hypothetical protein
MSKSVATSDPSIDQPAPPAVDWAVVLLIAAFGAMFLPTYYTLSLTAWGTDSNGHGPMILGLCFWLLWRDRAEILGATGRPAPAAAFLILSLALVLYIIGRSQGLDTLEAAAQIPTIMAGMLLLRGWAGVRKAWFPIFFLIFMVPLPGVVTQAGNHDHPDFVCLQRGPCADPHPDHLPFWRSGRARLHARFCRHGAVCRGLDADLCV